MPVKLKVKKTFSPSPMDSSIKYLLIASLVLLLGFAFVYIYNIHNSMKKEGFEGATEEEAMYNVNQEEVVRSKSSHSDFYYNVGPAFDNKTEVIYLYYNGCPYCVKFSPVFDSFSRSANMPNVVFKSFEKNDPNTPSFNDFSVQGYPTVVVVKDKKVVASQVGATSYDDLQEFVTLHTK